jgi:endo-1,4-beta-mannosidase
MRPIFLEISFAHLREGLFCENDDSPIWDKPNELKKFVPNRETIFQRCKIEFQIGKPFFNVAKSNSKSGIHFSMLQNRIPNRETIFQRCKAESRNRKVIFDAVAPFPKWDSSF